MNISMARPKESIINVLVAHREAGYMFGPDRWMTVNCECGLVTAADDYLASNAHVAAVEVHAQHQAEVIGAAMRQAGADVLSEATASSPRLPFDMRGHLFRIMGEFMEDFELESRRKGPNRFIAAPGHEWGDMCGYFEKRVVATLRAANIAEAGRGEG